MDRPLKEIVYTPESELLNFGRLARQMWSDLLASRELAWRLLVRNVSAQYRQSLLGYLWAFLPPIFTTAIWVFLQSQRVFNVADTGMPYPVFVLTGTVLWQTFVEALQTPLRTVTESKAMLSKINFPREALVLAGVGEVLVNFLIRVIVLIPMFWWFGVQLHASVLLAPLGILSIILLGTSIGLLLTPLGMLYQDVGRALTFGTQALFFLTPIIYPVPIGSWAGILVSLNPVTPLLQVTREWLILGSASQMFGFFVVVSISLVLLLASWILFRISMPHLISRMNA